MTAEAYTCPPSGGDADALARGERAGAERGARGLEPRDLGVRPAWIVVEQPEPPDVRRLGRRHGLLDGGVAPPAAGRPDLAEVLGRGVLRVVHQQVGAP